ncbi:MAG: cyclase family protein [Gemmatimonadota bacterium]|nr:cyclase family protein [Gemmatimonadota bacterium]
MRLRDISITLAAGTPEWPGDTPYSCGWNGTLSQGSSVNVSSYTTSPHVGTHADAPLHVRDGWPGSHELPLDAFYGRAAVVDVTGITEVIEAEALANSIGDGNIERLLLRTGCTIGSGSFPESWPALSEACARILLGRGLRLLGVDAPSVDERYSKSLPVHKMIFSGNAYILENLDLRRIPPGTYDLMAFPVKIMSLDAAPVRAILREIE